MLNIATSHHPTTGVVPTPTPRQSGHGGHESLTQRLARAEARLADCDAARARALRVVNALRAQMGAVRVGDAEPAPRTGLRPVRTPTEKVALFRSLFAGRADVFPLYWFNSKTGKSGYSPACANEWVRGVCDKPRVKCGGCPNQAFVPVTEHVLRDHLLGHHVAGVYPLYADETCRFLAADFDNDGWQQDVSAFAATCRSHEVPIAIERSRSGNGAHVWFFFTDPVQASTARQMACFLLTETMRRRPELPMSSYDRLFPNQDTMPRGGFGNLIALPLQGNAREHGNTVFLDERFEPHPDQWSYLASVRRMNPREVTAIAQRASNTGQVIGAFLPDEASSASRLRTASARPTEPYRATVDQPLPRRVRATLTSRLVVEKPGLSPELVDQIRRTAAFQNPEFYKRQSLRLSTALTPRVISCAEESPEHVAVPRGCRSAVEDLLRARGSALTIEDQRTCGAPITATFRGELREVQQQAVNALAAHETGVLVAPPGTGKTVIGAHLIAKRGVSTLVLVHRTQLLDQWRTQLGLFLGLAAGEIGQIGGGKRKANGQVDVAMIQSLLRKDAVADTSSYGHVVVDECHHVPAVSFERVMREVKARYVVGLTATPERRDGHHPILHFELGPVRFAVSAKSQAARRPLEHRLIVRETQLELDPFETPTIQNTYSTIISDSARNDLILDDILLALEEGRSPVLLTERREHLDFFASRLDGVVRNLVVLRGGMGARQRRAVADQLANIPNDQERLLLATGRFLGEGFDDARLDTLFLTMPVAWKGTLVQYAGRLHRSHGAKNEMRIYDYVDRRIPTLARMFEKRMKGYRAMGYRPA